MEELYINDILIELPLKSVSRTLQVNDIGDIKDRQSNYSNKIKIPDTPANKKTFEMLGIVGNTTRIPYTEVRVKYVVDGIELITDGKGIVKNTNSFYNLVIYDGNISLSDLLGDKQLNGLDYTAYNHNLTSLVYTNSFANTGGYIYSLARYYDSASTVVFNIDLNGQAFYVHTLFEMIFSQKGYTVTGNIFSNADYLSRVITMDSGFNRVSTDNKTIVLDRNNILDPSVNEVFASQTTKTYIIDEYTSVGSLPHEINLNGNVNIGHGTNAKILIKKDGLLAYSEDILSDVDFNITKTISVNNGSVLSVSIIIDSVFELAADRILFQTKYTTVIESNDLFIPIVFEDIIGKEKQIDFVKDIMQRFGLIFRKVRNKNEFNFISISELLQDKSGAEDWSDKYSNFSNETYTSNYAQSNTLKYLYDDNDNNKEQTFADGKMFVDNVNLQQFKTLITSIFKASEEVGSYNKLNLWVDEEIDNETVIVENEDGVRMFKVLKNTELLRFKYTDDIIDYNTFNGSVPHLNFSSIFYQKEVDNNYAEFNSLLNDYKFMTVELNLSILDIYQLDFFKLKTFNQLGNYFYLNKIINYKKNKKVKAEIVMLGEDVISALSIDGSINGSSTYEGTLTKLAFGFMSGVINGSSTYMATLRKDTFTSFTMSSFGVGEELVCEQTVDTEYWHNGMSAEPSNGNTVYTDAGGTTPLNGGDNYWKLLSNNNIKINSIGVVTLKSSC